MSFMISSQVDASTSVSIFLLFHIAPAFWAFWRGFREWSLLLKFLFIIFPSHVCHTYHFQRSRGNCSCSFSICCLLRLRRVTKKNLLQVQKSYSISLSEHFQIHSSASLGDLMIFAREMIWQNSKIYVSVLLLNSRFSQSKITCLFFFSWKDCQDGAVP